MTGTTADPAISSTPAQRNLGAAGIAAVAGKFLQVFTGALIGLLLPIALNIADVGVFFFIQAMTNAIIVLAALGLPLTVPVLIAHAIALGDEGRARSAALTSIKLCIIAGLVLGGIFFAASFAVRNDAMSQEVGQLAPLIGLLILAGALLGVLAEIHRALYGMVTASFLPVIQGTAISVYVMVALALKLPITIKIVLIVSILTAAAGILVGAVRLFRLMRTWQEAPQTPFSAADLLGQSWPNLITAASFVAASQLDIWVVGLAGRPADVGTYGLALRIASLISIPITIVSLTILPHIVTNWARQKRRYVQWLLTLSATGAVAVTACGYLLFLLFGKTIMDRLWGSAYDQAFQIALILGAGQILFAAGGAAGYVVILLGRQKAAMVSTLAIAAVTVVLATAAMLTVGLVGVAVVYAVSSSTQALVNVLMARKYFGLSPQARLINPLRATKLLTHVGAPARS